MLTTISNQKLNLTLPIEIKKKGDWFISSCPKLDVFSQGRTESEATANIDEAVSVFIESCIKRGVLSDVLKACAIDLPDIISDIETVQQKASVQEHISISPFIPNLQRIMPCHA